MNHKTRCSCGLPAVSTPVGLVCSSALIAAATVGLVVALAIVLGVASS